MYHITANNCAEAWIKATQDILDKGMNMGGLYEILNMGIEIKSSEVCPVFDKEFRDIFGDERIDYAKSVTFVKPEPNMLFPQMLEYQQNKEGKWTNSYWGRMISWNGGFNQIEQAIKRLRENKQAKTIVIGVYDPQSDGKKVMGGMPCLLTIDLKPRGGKLNLTANFRSQAVSKSGYADYMALVDLCDFLCKESGCLDFGLVTSFAHSCHVRTQNNELKNSRELMRRYDTHMGTRL
jgi:thymidylate synthase